MNIKFFSVALLALSTHSALWASSSSSSSAPEESITVTAARRAQAIWDLEKAGKAGAIMVVDVAYNDFCIAMSKVEVGSEAYNQLIADNPAFAAEWTREQEIRHMTNQMLNEKRHRGN